MQSVISVVMLASLLVQVLLCIPGQPAAQDEVGWDIVSCWDCNHTADIVGTVILALPAGIFLGFLRVIALHGRNAPRSILNLDPPD